MRQYASAFAEASKAHRRDIIWALCVENDYGHVSRRDYYNRQQTLRNWAIKYGFWEGRNTHATLSRAELRVLEAEQKAYIEEQKQQRKLELAAERAKKKEMREKAARFNKRLEKHGLTRAQFNALKNSDPVS